MQQNTSSQEVIAGSHIDKTAKARTQELGEIPESWELSQQQKAFIDSFLNEDDSL
ncbi:hypothetical protein [Mangrovibacter phragmitis]|jgi:hypothetical protein